MESVNTSAVSTVESGSSSAFMRQLAKSAGLPEELLAQKDSAELAQQIGAVLRLLTENLMQLLSARQEAKRLARSSSHTMIQAMDNNPLKFCPSAEDALRIMFGPKSTGYLDAQRAITQGFGDLKAHQIKTYSAMQHALAMVMADLDPEAIEGKSDGGGIGGLLQSRRAKLWEAYKARWETKVGRKAGEATAAFMRYFAEYYDRDGG
jgi:type VI secretion system protein ImpI